MISTNFSDVLKKINNKPGVFNISEKKDIKIYPNEEAGEYIETTYKGITVYVRENYPYYNKQNEKIYYSKEEEAEELYQLSRNMNKSSLHNL